MFSLDMDKIINTVIGSLAASSIFALAAFYVVKLRKKYLQRRVRISLHLVRYVKNSTPDNISAVDFKRPRFKVPRLKKEARREYAKALSSKVYLDFLHFAVHSTETPEKVYIKLLGKWEQIQVTPSAKSLNLGQYYPDYRTRTGVYNMSVKVSTLRENNNFKFWWRKPIIFKVTYKRHDKKVRFWLDRKNRIYLYRNATSLIRENIETTLVSPLQVSYDGEALSMPTLESYDDKSYNDLFNILYDKKVKADLKEYFRAKSQNLSPTYPDGSKWNISSSFNALDRILQCSLIAIMVSHYKAIPINLESDDLWMPWESSLPTQSHRMPLGIPNDDWKKIEIKDDKQFLNNHGSSRAALTYIKTFLDAELKPLLEESNRCLEMKKKVLPSE